MPRCDECLSEAPAGAARCARCGEVIGGKACPDCGTRARDEARVCRWCGHRFRGADIQVAVEPRRIRARILPSVLFRGRFIPQDVTVSENELVVRAPGLFYLWTNEGEIPWNKVSGFNYRDGIVWDSLTIETRGQESETIVGLAKSDGAEIRTILRGLER